MSERLPPRTLYLQWWGADQRDLEDCPDPVPVEITHCEDKQYDTDVEYIRKDEYDKLLSKYHTVRDALRQAGRDLCGCACALDHNPPHSIAHMDVMHALEQTGEEQ